MRDIEIKNALDLMTAMYDIPRSSEHGRYRSDFVYRGLANKDWDLETSLHRLGGNYVALEGPMLRSFRKYAEPGAIPSDDFWVRLSVAQHHGLPTRVMDWTLSPRIAAHFATFEEEHYDKDGVIWCIDVAKARALLPKILLDILNAEYAWLFSVEMLASIQSIAALDGLAGRNEAKKPFLIFFEPPSLDGRIVNQAAVLSVLPGADLRLADFLAMHPDIYKRIIIPRDLKWEVRDKLDQDNVTERMLFPGLDGLTRWLKRYYGPGAKGGKALPAEQIRKAGP